MGKVGGVKALYAVLLALVLGVGCATATSLEEKVVGTYEVEFLGKTKMVVLKNCEVKEYKLTAILDEPVKQ